MMSQLLGDAGSLTGFEAVRSASILQLLDEFPSRRQFDLTLRPATHLPLPLSSLLSAACHAQDERLGGEKQALSALPSTPNPGGCRSLLPRTANSAAAGTPLFQGMSAERFRFVQVRHGAVVTNTGLPKVFRIDAPRVCA